MKKLMLILFCGFALFAMACGSDEGASASVTASTEPTAGAEQPAIEEPTDVRIEGDHLAIDDHINFENDSDVILETSNDLLNHIASVLKNHSEIATVKIIGHTDTAGDDAHNLDLSARRAASVLKALEERGVTQKLSSDGVGEKELHCHEDTEECHAKNRRVEFVITMVE